MNKKYISATLCISLLFSVTTYANTYQEQSLIVNNKLLEQLDYHWEYINGKWYYKDDFGNIKNGRFIDQYGDIYDTEGNLDHSIIISGSNSRNEQFGSDGRLVNTSMINYEKNLITAKQYELGNEVLFNTKSDFVQFIEFYTVQYRLNTYTASHYLKGVEGDFKSVLSTNYLYNREQIITKILNNFGRVSGDNPYDAIEQACLKVSKLNYDENSAYNDIASCIDNNRGVCWHFAKIVSVILDDAGIYNELMVGTFNDGYHMWLRCKVNNKWVYVDPTGYRVQGSAYANIDYQKYLTEYFATKK